ncbi:MAG: hypothetical protein ACT4OY_05270 [Alphaproteobacteria bacterium]
MNANEEVEKLEKVIGQLQGAYAEVSILAKKSPADALNAFKLNLINNVIKTANEVLGEKYRPFDHFDKFDPNDLPSNSDVTMILAQYMEEAERFRSDNVIYVPSEGWVYKVAGKSSGIKSGPPSKIGKK